MVNEHIEVNQLDYGRGDTLFCCAICGEEKRLVRERGVLAGNVWMKTRLAFYKKHGECLPDKYKWVHSFNGDEYSIKSYSTREEASIVADRELTKQNNEDEDFRQTYYWVGAVKESVLSTHSEFVPDSDVEEARVCGDEDGYGNIIGWNDGYHSGIDFGTKE